MHMYLHSMCNAIHSYLTTCMYVHVVYVQNPMRWPKLYSQNSYTTLRMYYMYLRVRADGAGVTSSFTVQRT